MSGVYIGVDLGGTNIKIGLCDSEGTLLHQYEGPTGAEQGAEAVISRIAGYAHTLVDMSSYSWDQVQGVGVGVPGMVDIKNGMVKLASNLQWRNVPAKEMLEKQLGKEAKFDNDANLAVVGEAWAGAGKGIDNIVCYTLGTGVGGGVMVDGKLVHGIGGSAGEIGHMQIVPDIEAIVCGCGQLGCLETVSSATGIVRMAKEAVARGEDTSLSLLSEVTAKDIFQAAKFGDEVSLRVINRAAYYIGRSMALLSVVLNPQRFIIGGGVSKAGEFLLGPIIETYEKYTVGPAKEGVDIVLAELGNDAGIIGAAGLICNHG